MSRDNVVFRAEHGSLSIGRPAPRVVIVTLVGNDVGQFGEAPFQELGPDVDAAARAPDQAIELFIDARGAIAASLDVSSDWAIWLGRHKRSFRHVSMLTGSRFIQLSAGFVRKFADMGELMRLYSDPAAFEGALSSSIANAHAHSELR
jgi:hypothetical protein